MPGYFDNAATTYPKPEEVYVFPDKVVREYGVNIGRGSYDLSFQAGRVVFESKENLRRLFRAEGKEIVYTSSATDALNRIILGLTYAENANVYISPFEHNAVTRALCHLKSSKNLSIHTLPFDPASLLLDEAAMRAMFKKTPPFLVVMTHASNVCGAVVPVETIAAAAKDFESIVVVDMSQTAGLVPVRVGLRLFDFAVFAGHKTLYAPFGVGGFVCEDSESRLSPVFFGGNGLNSIDQEMPKEIVKMEEVGSQNIYAIAGLKASTDWLIDQGEKIRRNEDQAKDILLQMLKSYNNIEIVGGGMSCPRIGVVSCLFDGYSPSEISVVLNSRGIATRAGLHCAPCAHRFLKTLPSGTVRFSVSALTSKEDFDLLGQALDYISRNA